MPIVRIELSVPSFDRWKQAFDSDPADRKGSGVRRYLVTSRISGPVSGRCARTLTFTALAFSSILSGRCPSQLS